MTALSELARLKHSRRLEADVQLQQEQRRVKQLQARPAARALRPRPRVRVCGGGAALPPAHPARAHEHSR